MQVEVIESTVDVRNVLGNRYVYTEMRCGKHSALVVDCRGESNYVRVVVLNAANRAWRGMGKEFPNKEAALAKYKTAAIRSMIEHGVELGDEAERRSVLHDQAELARIAAAFKAAGA